MGHQAQTRRILRMRDICQKLGLCPSTVHDLVARGIFIKPFTLIPGGRAVGWLEVDVDQWIFDRKEASSLEAL
jgi:prophage regulatory protein